MISCYEECFNCIVMNLAVIHARRVIIMIKDFSFLKQLLRSDRKFKLLLNSSKLMIRLHFERRIFRRILDRILKHERIVTLTMNMSNDTCTIDDKNVE
jgi:hypothetical protein